MANGLSDNPANAKALLASLRKKERLQRSDAFWLTMPLVLFLSIFFVWPIADLLWRSVHNPTLSDVLPHTTAALQSWSGKGNPPPRAYSALPQDLQNASNRQTLARAASRLNVEMDGFSSMLRKAATQAERMSAPYAPAFGAIDPRWGSRETWVTFKHAAEVYTMGFYLAAMDRTRNVDREIVEKPPEERLHVEMYLRTFMIAGLVTLLCLFLGYPTAALIAQSGPVLRTFFLILVLLPFWTSIIVRTASWEVLLQDQGVINNVLVWAGIINDDARLPLIRNMTATLVAMTHILLPFMVLPVYAVMLSVPPHYVRAARSLGAGPWTAFWDIYFPLTLSGVGAGVMLVFILAIGFYITPEQVGGETDMMIGNFINRYMTGKGAEPNWGLAAALSGLLLAFVLMLYLFFVKAIGLEKLRIA